MARPAGDAVFNQGSTARGRRFSSPTGDPMTEFLSHWPGKSVNDTGTEHPAVYHMLDVAAVAEILIGPLDIARQVREAFFLLAARHDLGKINAVFRQMVRGGAYQGNSHWRMSELWLLKHDDFLAARLGGSRQQRRSLYAATAGHHGVPPDWNPDLTRADAVRAFRRAGNEAATNARLYDFAPRPMQLARTEIALPAGPMLAVIEDETGAGKTEAAQILAQRMLLAGKGKGPMVPSRRWPPRTPWSPALHRRSAPCSPPGLV